MGGGGGVFKPGNAVTYAPDFSVERNTISALI